MSMLKWKVELLPWAACPSEVRRKLKEGSGESETVSGHKDLFGWRWRERELIQ